MAQWRVIRSKRFFLVNLYGNSSLTSSITPDLLDHVKSKARAGCTHILSDSFLSLIQRYFCTV